MKSRRCASPTASLVRRLAGGVSGDARPMIAAGTARWLNRDKRPNSFLCRPTRPTWPASRTAPSSARPPQERRRPDQQLGRPRRDEGDADAGCSPAACAAARCTSSPSAWARSARTSPTSASSSPTRPTSSSTCAIMTRMGKGVLDVLGDDGGSCRACTRSGARSSPASRTCPGRATPRTSTSCHFPEKREIWSFGSGYGGNALLGKKCFALRIASVMARDEGWLAEHMLILGSPRPRGAKKYIAAAFPRAAARPTWPCSTRALPGWKVETVGDDIAWMKFGAGRPALRHQPRGRLLRRRPGHQRCSPTPTPWRRSARNSHLHQRARMTADGDVWWEEMTDEPPARADRLEGPGLDAGLRPQGGRTPTPASPRRPRSAR